MTLPEIIAEVEKLEFGHKKAVLSKLTVAVGILKNVKEAEHLLKAPEKPPEPVVAEEPVSEPPKKGTRRKVVDAMPEGG